MHGNKSVNLINVTWVEPPLSKKKEGIKNSTGYVTGYFLFIFCVLSFRLYNDEIQIYISQSLLKSPKFLTQVTWP